ncbi:hypothetical protein BHM03_00003565 [Ensete ventricosum]|nr:hypothetical protein BHM03_00003565 [Ensete ventricosum]
MARTRHPARSRALNKKGRTGRTREAPLQDGVGALGSTAGPSRSDARSLDSDVILPPWRTQTPLSLGSDAPVKEKLKHWFAEVLNDLYPLLESKKSDPPSLDHGVWRLVNIGRNGAFHRRPDAAGDFLKLAVVKLVYEAYQNWNRLERVVGMPDMIGAQNQSIYSFYARMCNPPDGSQRELSSSNVTPRLGASACVLEQLPSQQRVNTNILVTLA